MTEQDGKLGLKKVARVANTAHPHPRDMNDAELCIRFGGEIDPSLLEFPLIIGDDVPDPIEALPLLVRLLCQAEEGLPAKLTSAQQLAIDDLLLPAGGNFVSLMAEPAEALALFAELRRLAELRIDGRIHDLADRALAAALSANPQRETVTLALERVRKLALSARETPSTSQLVQYASGLAVARLQVKLAMLASLEPGEVFWRHSRGAYTSSEFLHRLRPAVFDLATQIAYSRAALEATVDSSDDLFSDVDAAPLSVEDLRIPDPAGFGRRSPYAHIVKRHAQEQANSQADGEVKDISSVDAEPEPIPHGHIIVVPKLPKSKRDAEWQSEQLKKISGIALPLIKTPDLSIVRKQLVLRHPHLVGVIGTILKSLVPQEFVKMPPTLFVGNPGCGKSTLAADLGFALGLPTVSIDVGGMSDTMILGSSRKWSNGTAGINLQTVMDHSVANPLLIIDELEKSGGNERNGDIRQQLLGLLETKTAEGYVDRFLEVPTNYSAMNWLFTANDIKLISKPLRSRLRILSCPDPTLEHLPALASNLLKAEYMARGLDERWVTPLTGVELIHLEKYWLSGSLRDLQKYIRGIINWRDQCQLLPI